MPRPLWERALVHTVADHLRRQGIGTDAAAYSLAALVVRGLDRRTGLSAEMARFPITSLVDVDDPEKTSLRHLQVLERFWGSVAGKGERNKLVLLAMASALRAGPGEAKAAADLAREAPLDEPILGKIGGEWIPQSPWELEGTGFGALRDEMALTGSAVVLAAYDKLVADERDRAEVVKIFQTWAKNVGTYTGRVDGVWGPKSESAFIRVVPAAAGRLSELRDVPAVKSVIVGTDGQSIAVLISRDLWLEANPDKLAEEVPPAPPPGDGSQVVVSYPKAETATSTPLPGGGVQVVVSYPKPTGSPEQVAIELPSPDEVDRGVMDVTIEPQASPSRDILIGGGLVLGGVLIMGAAWWLQRRQQQQTPLLTETTP